MQVVAEDGDFETQDDFMCFPEDTANGRVRYKFVVPSEDPDGNLPTDIVWTGVQGQEYTADELLDLCQEMRLGRTADLYGHTAAQGDNTNTADIGNDGDADTGDDENSDGEAAEADDDTQQQEESGSESNQNELAEPANY